MSGTLVLVRHGQSEWNLKNLFTGWRDVDLTEQGHAGGQERPAAKLAARGMKFDIAFTSVLKRAQKTCQHILDAVGQSDLETIRDQALNERDYGDLSGLNKDDARAKWGEEQVHIWRRSYDIAAARRREPEATPAPASGPTTCTTCSRTCCAARTVLVAAHGNSLRALIMALEGCRARRSSSWSSAPACRSSTGSMPIRRVASKEVLDGGLRSAACRSGRPKTALTHAACPLTSARTCPDGGIGRRARFRSVCRKAWRFESSSGHQTIRATERIKS